VKGVLWFVSILRLRACREGGVRCIWEKGTAAPCVNVESLLVPLGEEEVLLQKAEM